jgi:DNA-binding transcriptional ArsR family regulator
MQQLFAALGDGTRLQVLDALKSGEKTVAELVALTPFKGPTLTRHLDVLERNNLIVRRKDGNRRMCALNRKGFDDAFRWCQDYRAFWNAAMSRLQTELSEEATR